MNVSTCATCLLLSCWRVGDDQSGIREIDAKSFLHQGRSELPDNGSAIVGLAEGPLPVASGFSLAAGGGECRERAICGREESFSSHELVRAFPARCTATARMMIAALIIISMLPIDIVEPQHVGQHSP